MFNGHLPVIDGSLKGWLGELDALAALPADAGRARAWAAGRALARRARRRAALFRRLAGDLQARFGRGEDIGSAADTAAGVERERWRLFDDYNARNASAAYAEYEWDP